MPTTLPSLQATRPRPPIYSARKRATCRPEILERCDEVVKISDQVSASIVGVAGALVMYDRMIAPGAISPKRPVGTARPR